jgi:hypothetical protein
MQYISKFFNLDISSIMAISALIKAGVQIFIILIHLFLIIRTVFKWKNKTFKTLDDVEKYIKFNYYYNTILNMLVSLVTIILLCVMAIKHYYY